MSDDTSVEYGGLWNDDHPNRDTDPYPEGEGEGDWVFHVHPDDPDDDLDDLDDLDPTSGILPTEERAEELTDWQDPTTPAIRRLIETLVSESLESEHGQDDPTATSGDDDSDVWPTENLLPTLTDVDDRVRTTPNPRPPDATSPRTAEFLAELGPRTAWDAQTRDMFRRPPPQEGNVDLRSCIDALQKAARSRLRGG